MRRTGDTRPNPIGGSSRGVERDHDGLGGPVDDTPGLDDKGRWLCRPPGRQAPRQ